MHYLPKITLHNNYNLSKLRNPLHFFTLLFIFYFVSLLKLCPCYQYCIVNSETKLLLARLIVSNYYVTRKYKKQPGRVTIIYYHQPRRNPGPEAIKNYLFFSPGRQTHKATTENQRLPWPGPKAIDLKNVTFWEYVDPDLKLGSFIDKVPFFQL